jgi:general secretion pathway protein G
VRTERIKSQKAFTLVEILICVLVLSILAAIAAPQFSDASEDAKESQLLANIQVLRQQIALYQLQHNGRLPHLNQKGKRSYNKAIQRLLGTTNVDGKLTADGEYGPYINSWPANPLADGKNAAAIQVGTNDWPPRNGRTGWYYCTETGIVSANSETGGEALDPPKD